VHIGDHSVPLRDDMGSSGFGTFGAVVRGTVMQEKWLSAVRSAAQLCSRRSSGGLRVFCRKSALVEVADVGYAFGPYAGSAESFGV
jgi:hypothetical protein